MNSLAHVMKAETATFSINSIISKRSITLLKHLLTKAMKPGGLVIVDAPGLKVYGKDEWPQKNRSIDNASAFNRMTNLGMPVPVRT